MHLVLFHPEIPQNVGTLLRASACLGFPVDLVEPFGFLWSSRHLRRAGMDYIQHTTYQRHRSMEAYCNTYSGPCRRLALVPHGKINYLDVIYEPTDHLWVGSESQGFPAEVQREADLEIQIPMGGACRSLNMAIAAMIVMGEGLRQTNAYPSSRTELP